MKVPTEKQYELLQILSNASRIALVPSRRDWGPLLRHGWVEGVLEDDDTSRFLPPLRITPAGLVALAAALERYGHPEVDISQHVQASGEPRFIAKLRQDLDEARAERDRARRAARDAQLKLSQIKRLAIVSEEAA